MEAEVGQLEAVERVGLRVSREANCCLIQSANRTQLITKQRLWFQLKTLFTFWYQAGTRTPGRGKEAWRNADTKQTPQPTKFAGSITDWSEERRFFFFFFLIYLFWFVFGRVLSPVVLELWRYPCKALGFKPMLFPFLFLMSRSWTEHTAHDARRTTLASIQLSVKFYSTEEKPVEHASITG